MRNRLKLLRAERDWSQAEVASRLQISRQSFNAVETGKFDPSLPLAFRIAQLFETTIEAIFEPDAPQLKVLPHNPEHSGDQPPPRLSPRP